MKHHESTNKSTKPSTPKIELLKTSKVKDGHRYDNLYLRVNDGNPIAIKLTFNDFRVKCMLLANATPCEIKNVTLVRTNPQEETEY